MQAGQGVTTTTMVPLVKAVVTAYRSYAQQSVAARIEGSLHDGRVKTRPTWVMRDQRSRLCDGRARSDRPTLRDGQVAH